MIRLAVPLWLDILGDIFVGLGILSAIYIAASILRGNHQKMKIMNVVWPITGFYMPLFGIWAYHKMQMTKEKHEAMQRSKMERPFWQKSFVSTSHCGAGCTYGDIIGEFAIFFAAITLFGVRLWASYTIDLILAYSFGIVFQFFAIVPMKHLKPKEGVKEALKADTLSILAFEVGLFAWMAITFFVLFNPPLEASSAVYWFMMQIGMSIGFLTSFPANWYLVKKKIKAAM